MKSRCIDGRWADEDGNIFVGLFWAITIELAFVAAIYVVYDVASNVVWWLR